MWWIEKKNHFYLFDGRLPVSNCNFELFFPHNHETTKHKCHEMEASDCYFKLVFNIDFSISHGYKQSRSSLCLWQTNKMCFIDNDGQFDDSHKNKIKTVSISDYIGIIKENDKKLMWLWRLYRIMCNVHLVKEGSNP